MNIFFMPGINVLGKNLLEVFFFLANLPLK